MKGKITVQRNAELLFDRPTGHAKRGTCQKVNYADVNVALVFFSKLNNTFQFLVYMAQCVLSGLLN